MLGLVGATPHEPSVLIVEDDPDLRTLLAEGLALQDFQVQAVGSALELYRMLGQWTVDVVVVDLGLPDLDGLEITRFLRQQTAMGIIAITANTAPDTRLRFFESGADLFLTKPVDCRELAVAVRGLTQRLRAGSVQGHSGPAPAGGSRSVVVTGNTVTGESTASQAESSGQHWLVDSGAWTISVPNGRSAHLSAKEMRLVTLLCRSPGETVPRDLLRSTLGYADNDDGDRALEALIRRLRSKLKLVWDNTTPIQTVHGSGYLFSASVVVR